MISAGGSEGAGVDILTIGYLVCRQLEGKRMCKSRGTPRETAMVRVVVPALDEIWRRAVRSVHGVHYGPVKIYMDTRSVAVGECMFQSMISIGVQACEHFALHSSKSQLECRSNQLPDFFFVNHCQGVNEHITVPRVSRTCPRLDWRNVCPLLHRPSMYQNSVRTTQSGA